MTDWHDLSGHVALVTGGNSGIGLGMARGLRRAGAAVAVWGTNGANNDAGVPGRPAPIDTMSTDEWRRLMSVNLDGQFFTVRAVAGHMKARLAVELARETIRVNAIVPGWTEAAMTEGLLDSPAAQSKILPTVPLRRYGTPEDYEAMAVWSASPGSSYFTGQTLVVDGGYTIF